MLRRMEGQNAKLVETADTAQKLRDDSETLRMYLEKESMRPVGELQVARINFVKLERKIKKKE